MEGELRRLAEEIAASYEARILAMDDLKAGVSVLKEESKALVNDFCEARRNDAKGLREELTRFKVECQEGVADLRQVTRSLLQDVAARRQEVRDTLRQQLGQFRTELQQGKQDLDADEDRRRQEAAEQIKARTDLIGGIRQETRGLLTTFREARQETGQALKANLATLMSDIRTFQADLARSEQQRKQQVRQELQDISESLSARLGTVRQGLREFQSDLVKGEKKRKIESQGHLKDLRVELGTLFDGLNQDLRRFRTDLQKADQDRQRRVRGELREMARDLHNRLGQFREATVDVVRAFLGELNQNRTRGAAAWREILGAMRAESPAVTEEVSPAGKVETAKTEAAPADEAPAVRQAPVEETSQATFVPETSIPIETAADSDQPSEDSEEKAPDQEAQRAQDSLAEEILDLLRAHPEGLKMVELSEMVGLPNWRSLIPVMRELMDEEAVRKEETSYFAL